ncbi:MAG: hypothetical protein AB1705_23070 [Verrucomicrobiota bacterium]
MMAKSFRGKIIIWGSGQKDGRTEKWERIEINRMGAPMLGLGLLINTPLQRGAGAGGREINCFNSFRCMRETVETVEGIEVVVHTSLKRGVNETGDEPLSAIASDACQERQGFDGWCNSLFILGGLGDPLREVSFPPRS